MHSGHSDPLASEVRSIEQNLSNAWLLAIQRIATEKSTLEQRSLHRGWHAAEQRGIDEDWRVKQA